MRWTLRRRVELVGLACLVAGVTLGGGLLGAAQWVWGGRVLCRAGLPGTATVCAQASRHYRTAHGLVSAVALLVAVALLLWGLASAARWCLRPLRDVALTVGRVGPTNLGQRVQAGGDSDLAVVGDAVDAMMERVAAGYEGQRRFAANASHELRTPLSVQRTLIEVGLTPGATPEQLDLLTRQLLATNERNERLIEGLLVLAESDQGLASRTPQRLDLVTAGVVSTYADAARTAGVSVTTDLSARTVLGERVLLERLVTNLVQNALRYNREGGTMHVRVGADPALSVANTGPPVPAERVGEIFEPFRRLSGERTDHSGGSGLGLTIARSITAAHGGSIRAVPQDGGGLRVDVHLPAVAVGQAELGESAQEPAAAPWAPGPAPADG